MLSHVIIRYDSCHHLSELYHYFFVKMIAVMTCVAKMIVVMTCVKITW